MCLGRKWRNLQTANGAMSALSARNVSKLEVIAATPSARASCPERWRRQMCVSSALWMRCVACGSRTVRDAGSRFSIEGHSIR